MDKKLKELVQNELGKARNAGNKDEFINSITSFINSLHESVEYLNEIKQESLVAIFNTAKQELNIHETDEDEKEGILWTQLKHNDKSFNLEAHFCFKEEDKPYLGFMHVSSKKDKETDEWLKSIFNSDEWKREFDNNKWYCWRYTTYEGIISDFRSIYETVRGHINNQ